MFVRKRISPSKRQSPSYQVLESYRDPFTRKPKHRVLMNLGNRSPEQAIKNDQWLIEQCRAMSLKKPQLKAACDEQIAHCEKRIRMLEACSSPNSRRSERPRARPMSRPQRRLLMPPP